MLNEKTDPMIGKVVLIRPKNFLGYNTYPPLALICLGSALEKEGYDVKIIDAAKDAECEKMIIDECKDAILVGITATTAEVSSAIDITDMIKKDINVPIVWGGWHTTLFPEQVIEDSAIDFIIIGEGDVSITLLAQAIKQKGSFENIKGLGYKNGGEIKINFTKDHVEIENLPMINYNLVNIENYINSKINDRCSSGEYSSRWLPYQSSRGCPGMCTFCINEVTNNSAYRAKSSKKVLEEMQVMIEKYKANHIRFIDDNFFVNKQRATEICQGILERKWKITWDAECRVDYFNDHYINDEFLDLASKTGLIELTLGIESGSPKTLQKFNKRITPEQSIRAVESCGKHNIVPRCSFIVGSPDEEKEDMIMTAKLINTMKKINPEMVFGVVTFRPYPKCKLTEDLRMRGLYKDPEKLRNWKDISVTKAYTERTFIQPWQKYPSLSNNISFYFTLSSGVQLATHQIKNPFLRPINELFIKLAKFRVKRLLFGLPVEKYLYDKFYRSVMKYKL